MKAIHLVTNFVGPALLYMGILLYFMSALSIVGSLGKDPGFLVVGLITFILGYNSWHFGMKAKDEKAAAAKSKKK